MDIDEIRRADRDAAIAYSNLVQERNQKEYQQIAEASRAIVAVLAAEYGERLDVLERQRAETKALLAEAEVEAGRAELAKYPSGIVAEWGRGRHIRYYGAKSWRQAPQFRCIIPT